MVLTLHYLGHATWVLETGQGTLIIDPFFNGDAKPLPSHYVLVSHAHADHLADAPGLLRQNGATLIANFEICQWFEKQGPVKTEPMNIGGCLALPFGKILMTPAWHSSTFPDGTPAGNPCGFLISLRDPKVPPLDREPILPLSKELAENTNIYFACDTGFSVEMDWIGACRPTVAVLPIGDRYTMGPGASLEAIHRLRPRYVIPSHYNTWAPIAQDVERWAEAVRTQTDAVPVVLESGEKWTLPHG